MLSMPSARRKKRETKKLNLVSIMDAVFIFIFFLLLSSDFVHLFQIQSDVPIVSTSEPPKKEKIPLALTLKIYEESIKIFTGLPSQMIKEIPKEGEKFNLSNLHNYLIDIKKNNLEDEDVIIEPIADITYEELVLIMDAARSLQTTDEALFKKNKEGMDEKIELLFPKIVFGNINS